MAASNIHGSKGKVIWDGNDVSEVQSWDLDYSVEIIDGTTLTTSTIAKGKLAGLTDWTVTLEILADDTGPFANEGDSATVDLWLGTQVSDGHYTGTAIVESINIVQDPGDYGRATYTLRGTSSLSYSTE